MTMTASTIVNYKNIYFQFPDFTKFPDFSNKIYDFSKFPDFSKKIPDFSKFPDLFPECGNPDLVIIEFYCKIYSKGPILS